jgi:uncharacterized membrane protein
VSTNIQCANFFWRETRPARSESFAGRPGSDEYTAPEQPAVVEFVCDPSGLACHWVIRPNQSLSWRASLQVYAAIVLCIIGITIAYVLHGLWWVLPFAGFEILVLGIAFYLCLARSQLQEVVAVDADVVSVEKGRHAPEEYWECPRPWARISLEEPAIAWYPSRLAIAFQGRQIEIGRFLNEEERRALAVELQQIIHRRDWTSDPAG